jgi:SSS family solute:Na+ symporter
MVILGLLWIPIIRHMPGTLYSYLQSVQSYIAPPIFAVFFLGVFSKRINAYGCMTGLVVGFILGMLRLVAEIANNAGYAPTLFSEGSLALWYATTPFTFMCIYLTVICVAVIVAASLMTPKPREERLVGLTYSTSTAEQRQITRSSWNWLDVVLTCGLLCIILSIYVYFSG